MLCQVRKGVHPVYAGLHVSFPLKDSRLLKRLRRCVSALAHWSPVVGELAFLPELAFPFVKLFGTTGGAGEKGGSTALDALRGLERARSCFFDFPTCAQHAESR